MSKNIVLIGFMGAGKTRVAKCLARKLCRDWVSTDAVIVKQEGRPIADIFAEQGEPYFRRLEQRVVAEAAGKSGIIIDCGGGVPVNPQNMSWLKARGCVFYLAASPEVIYQRVRRQKHRPLLAGEDDPLPRIRALLAQRQPFYASADYVVDTDGRTVEDTCEDVHRILLEQQLLKP
jgi:shikimate kinase